MLNLGVGPTMGGRGGGGGGNRGAAEETEDCRD